MTPPVGMWRQQCGSRRRCPDIYEDIPPRELPAHNESPSVGNGTRARRKGCPRTGTDIALMSPGSERIRPCRSPGKPAASVLRGGVGTRTGTAGQRELQPANGEESPACGAFAKVRDSGKKVWAMRKQENEHFSPGQVVVWLVRSEEGLGGTMNGTGLLIFIIKSNYCNV